MGATRNWWEPQQHENDIETINKNQEEIKNAISKMKNTLEGIKSMLDEAEDQIHKLNTR